MISPPPIIQVSLPFPVRRRLLDLCLLETQSACVSGRAIWDDFRNWCLSGLTRP